MLSLTDPSIFPNLFDRLKDVWNSLKRFMSDNMVINQVALIVIIVCGKGNQCYTVVDQTMHRHHQNVYLSSQHITGKMIL